MALLVTHSVVILDMCVEYDSLRYCKQTSFGSAQWVLRGFTWGGM